MPLIAGAATAGAAATAAAAGGIRAFKYDRENYLFDQSLRFSRYVAGYNFAIEQAAQYREDIRDLTELTVAKQDTYHIVGVIFFVIMIQLIMAGRLGYHGPSPPGWMMGLYWVNSTIAMMYLCAYTWLSMHASARATAGCVHMLTRQVRLPIPTPKQLDRARRTGNAFEKQRMTDVFRVPFIAPAPKDTIPEDDLESGKAKKVASVGKETASNRRMPRWYQDEQKELHKGEGGPAPLPSSVPEHFELYRGLQQEFACHDCYARIGMLYFMSYWLTSVSFYTQCHCFGELRAIWPSWSCTLIFCTAHYCLLQCDLAGVAVGKLKYLPMEYIMPWMPLIANLGMSFDYSVIKPTGGVVFFIFVCAWINYVVFFLWSIRTFQLAQPHAQAELPEAPGQPWWPAEWWLPRAFAQNIYIVAPPKHLEPGQTCLQQEMKAAKGAKGLTVPQKKAREIGPSLFPWRLFRGAIISTICFWVFIIAARIFEQIHGERMLLKPEGRLYRWPAHMQPFNTPWTREGSRNEWGHTGGSDRRLDEHKNAIRDEKVAAMAQRLAASLAPLAEAIHPHSAIQKLPAPLRANISWPSHFNPSLLASSSTGSHLVALARAAGQGALLHLPMIQDAHLVPTHFRLKGMDNVGALLGASWGKDGLLVATESGHVAECPGLPTAGTWPCNKVFEQLPTGGSSIRAASVVRMPGGLRAAISFSGEDSVLLLEATEGSWIPSGEVRLPRRFNKEHHFSFSSDGDELIISSHDGSALKWRMGEAEPTLVASAQDAGSVWHSACGLGAERFAHLASRTHGSMPDLFFSSRV
jgi:hypothetical protein